MASSGAFWELILLQLNCLSYTHKPVSYRLWLVKPAVASLCVKKWGGGILHDCSPGLKSGGHVPLSPPPWIRHCQLHW